MAYVSWPIARTPDMDNKPSKPDFRDEQADLQSTSLKIITLFVIAISYLWLLWVLWPENVGAIPVGAGVSTALLALSSIASVVLRKRHLRLASHMFVWGVFGAVVGAFFAFPSTAVAYAFILPIIFASVLLGQQGFFLISSLSMLLILSFWILDTSAHTPLGGVVLPISVIGLVALSSWLSARNLYIALAWMWHGFELSRQNEETARQRQAELRRTLKALDEATYRLERTNHMLAMARDQAEEARRLKQQFAQTISHELRTPLNLIVGFTELMTESPEYYGAQPPLAYLRDLNIVHRNACHLQNLVSDVLDLARIEAAQMTIVSEKVDPATLVLEAVETARSLVESHGLSLRTKVEADLPPLWVDPTRIRQVLFNLLNNAARFTKEGNIRINVHQQGQEVIFSVTDTGVGISPQDVPRLFAEFQQVDGGMRRRHEGAGLGLAISRQFIELHSGRIWAESDLGKGSTFSFALPVGYRDLAPGVIGGGLTAYAARQSGRDDEPILLAVTSSPSAAGLLSRYVRECHTVVASSLEQARDMAQQFIPQAVVIDRESEPLETAEVLALARKWGLPRVPFVACSLPGDATLRDQAAADGYLIKPVSRRDLWDVLRQFGADVDKILVVDDDQDFVMLMSRMLEDSPVRRYRVISAYSGQEGLTMMNHHHPDLVLLDLMLPDISGYQVIHRIRSNPAWTRTPVILVSAQDEADAQQLLKGEMVVSRVDGLMQGEMVQWIRNIVNTNTPRAVRQETGAKVSDGA
jgi:signal transduction histidine kinase/CheY-like chemotaxis protein